MDQLNERTSMSLGDRIILAARLAVAEHLGQSMAQQERGRKVAIGGAGPNFVGMNCQESSTPASRQAVDSVSRGARFTGGEVG